MFVLVRDLRVAADAVESLQDDELYGGGYDEALNQSVVECETAFAARSFFLRHYRSKV
jgi:hypothetical protein